MKRYLFILLLVLTACTSDNKDYIMIKEANLTNSEKQLLESLADASLVYDIELNQHHPAAIELSVDYYKNGMLKENNPYLKTSLSHEDMNKGKNESIRVLLAKQTASSDQVWTGSISHFSGSSSFKTDPQPINETSSYGYGYTNINQPIEMEEKHLIGYLIYSNDSSLHAPHEIYSEEQFEELINHEAVYLLYITLTNVE